MTSYLTDKVMSGQLNDRDNIYDHFMSLPNVYQRRHTAIFTDGYLDSVSFAEIDLGKLNWMYSGIRFSSYWSYNQALRVKILWLHL